MNKLVIAAALFAFVFVTIATNVKVQRFVVEPVDITVVKVFNVAVSFTNVNGVRAVAVVKG